MRKLIRYLEPYFNPYTHHYEVDNLTEYTVMADNENVYIATMMSITNPEREIPQESIVIEELPDEISVDAEQADMLAALQLLGVVPEEV